MSIMQMVNQFKQNPMAMLSKRYNIPQNIDTSDPNAIIQHLLNTGQISQQSYNAARMQVMQMQNNSNLK